MNNGLPKTLPGLENNMDFNDQGLPGEEVTLAEILKDEGYQPSTLASGIWGEQTAWRLTTRVLTKAC